MSVKDLFKLSPHYTLSELSFRKYLREQTQMSKAHQARLELEEQNRIRKQEAAIRSEREAEEKLRKIEEIKRKRQELLERKKQKELDIEFTKDRIALRERKQTALSRLSLSGKKANLDAEKQRLQEEKRERERIEKNRFSAELADRIVLISYQRLPTVLSLLRSYSKNQFDD